MPHEERDARYWQQRENSTLKAAHGKDSFPSSKEIQRGRFELADSAWRNYRPAALTPRVRPSARSVRCRGCGRSYRTRIPAVRRLCDACRGGRRKTA